MTKLRAPESVEDGVMQAMGLLGAETIAMALTAPAGRTFSASLLRKWADPDNHGARLDVPAALAIDALLIKAGHAPVFAPLFERQRPLPPAPADDTDPMAKAIDAAVGAAKLLEGVRAAVQDGALAYTEVSAIRAGLIELQRALAALNRGLVVKPKAGSKA